MINNVEKPKILFLGMGRVGKGIANEIKDWANSFYINKNQNNQKEYKYFFDYFKNEKEYSQIDLIVISLAGITPEKRMEYIFSLNNNYEIRLKELHGSIYEINTLLPLIKKFPKTVPIIVITNPTDEVATYLIGVLKRLNIYGYGAQLDLLRYEKMLGTKIKYLVGSHGNAIPVLSKTKKYYFDLYKKMDQMLLNYVREYDIPVKNVAVQFSDFLKKFFSKNSSLYHLGIYDKNYGVVVSGPTIISNQTVEADKKIILSDVEGQILRKIASDIKKHIEKYIEENFYKKTQEWYENAFAEKSRRDKGYGWPDTDMDRQDKNLISKYVKEKNNCLEIGFGDGRNLGWLVKYFNKVTGVDISTNAKNKVLNKFKNQNKKPKLLVKNLLNYSPKERYDFIFEWSVITHTPRILLNSYARKIESLLKPGSFYLLAVFSARDPHCPKNKYKISKGQYFNFFSKDDVKKIFPNFSICSKKSSILLLKTKSSVFKNKTKYIMDHYLLQKNNGYIKEIGK